MVIFNSDLDNTLIYSYKRNIGEEKKCVEIYQGREISFMTEKSFNLIKEVNRNLMFVPTTTRTIQQYKRIDLSLGVPKYALVCNGGILLVDGESEREWHEESLKLIAHCKSDLDKGIKVLEKDKNRSFEIRFIENLFIFTRSDLPEVSVEILKRNLNEENVDVFKIGTKVYVIPKILNKGTGVKRLKEKLNAKTIIAAGDSEFDIPMLDFADFAFAPKELASIATLNGKIKVVESIGVFSDSLLSEILHMIK